MTHKFKIGDIIFCDSDPKTQYQIVDITKDYKKVVKGDWYGIKEYTVRPNSYIGKSLETNKLACASIGHIDKYFQLFQQGKKLLKWKNYEEILV